MREIKFRAYTGEEMVILENSGLQYFDFEGSYSLGFTVDGYTEFWAHEQYDSATNKANKFPIMQYTGLTDKNGIEVYEGDILENIFTIKNYDDDDYHLENRYSSQYETKTHKSEVKFIKGEFRITSGISFNNCKIIGNIHENPELLK